MNVASTADPEPELYLPAAGGDRLSAEQVEQFYHNAFIESRQAGYSAEIVEAIFDYKCGLGTMLGKTPYFRRHYCAPLANSVNEIFARFSAPRILDVCCGIGTQALLFALKGGAVVAIDLDPLRLKTIRDRVAWYDGNSGRSLDIEVHRSDVSKDDFGNFGRFDVLYSHAGLLHHETPERIFERCAACLETGGLAIFKDTNPRALWYKGRFMNPILGTRKENIAAARKYGFSPLRVHGTTAFPKPVWRLGKWLEPIDNLIDDVDLLSVGFEYIFEKVG